jgi:hypothetical protein
VGLILVLQDLESAYSTSRQTRKNIVTLVLYWDIAGSSITKWYLVSFLIAFFNLNLLKHQAWYAEFLIEINLKILLRKNRSNMEL